MLPTPSAATSALPRRNPQPLSLPPLMPSPLRSSPSKEYFCSHICCPSPSSPCASPDRAVDLCCLYPPDHLAATSSWPGSTSPRLALGPSSALSGRRGAPALPLSAGQRQRRGGEARGGTADTVDAAAAEQEAREAQAQVGRRSQRRWLMLRLTQSKYTHARTMCLYIPTCRLQGSAVLHPLFVCVSHSQSEGQRSLFVHLCAHSQFTHSLFVCLCAHPHPQTAREAVQTEVALRVERAALLPAVRRDQRPSGTASQTLVRTRVC